MVKNKFPELQKLNVRNTILNLLKLETPGLELTTNFHKFS
jgi:hypothetical protein